MAVGAQGSRAQFYAGTGRNGADVARNEGLKGLRAVLVSGNEV